MSIEQQIRSITEDRRAGYGWETKTAARAINLHVNKVGQWWYPTRAKLIELYVAMPAETTLELMSIITEAEAERQRRASPRR